jgi:hypothetical protein
MRDRGVDKLCKWKKGAICNKGDQALAEMGTIIESDIGCREWTLLMHHRVGSWACLI